MKLAEFIKRDDWIAKDNEIKSLKSFDWKELRLISQNKPLLLRVAQLRSEMKTINNLWATSLNKDKTLYGQNNTPEFDSHVAHCEELINKGLKIWDELGATEGAQEGLFFLEQAEV